MEPSTKSILVIVHQSTSSPGRIGQLLRSRGYHLDIRTPSLGESLPPLTGYEGGIVFGGPMSANDDHLPHIRTELAWLEIALCQEKPLLGICLGAQLMARVLGAKVGTHPAGMVEIGYVSIRPTASGLPYFPAPMRVYQWHCEGFDLPEQATPLAAGTTFPHQAYRYGKRAFGLQFHPEMTARMLRKWTHVGAEHLVLPGAQPTPQQRQQHQQNVTVVKTWLQGFLNGWLN